MTSDKTIERLSLYRWLLERRVNDATTNLFSHQLASMAYVTPAQLRRDLMTIGYSGSPTKGYQVKDLARSIGKIIDGGVCTKVAVIGMGNLGMAIASFLRGRRAALEIVATFDNDETKAGRIISGCKCYALSKIEEIISEQKIVVAILTVPSESAQDVADRVVAAGVRGILNYAPVPLRVPDWVYLENRDVTTALEKVAYFARRSAEGIDK
jgi:redox-sensing transcriptional repressor